MKRSGMSNLPLAQRPIFSTLIEFARVLWRQSPPLFSFVVGVRITRAILPTIALIAAQRIIALIIVLTGNTNRVHEHIDGIKQHIAFWLLVELVVTILGSILTVAHFWLDREVNTKFVADMSVKVIEKSATIDLLTQESAEYQNRLARARRQITPQSKLLSQLLSPFQEAITCAAMTVGIAYYFTWPALLIIASTIPTLYGERWFNKLSLSLHHRQTERQRKSEYIRQLASDPAAAKEILLFGLSGFLVDRVKRNFDEVQVEVRLLGIKRAVWEAALSVGGNAVYFCCYIYAVMDAVEGRISIANLTFVLGAFLRLQSALLTTLRGLGNIGLQTQYLEDLFSFLAHKGRAKVSQPDGLKAQSKRTERVVFENVFFRYPGKERWTLENVSFNIGKDETVGLVGVNGSGKTTLAKLVCGLYLPTEGKIFIDGIEIDESSRERLWENIAGIFQDFVCYNMTFSENIAAGRIERKEDVESLSRSAKLTGADEAVSHLPNGMNQMLGRAFSGSIPLSGGEWQKLALSRVHFRNATLLVLDEPTAALDARSEARSLADFRAISKGKSVLLISHRLPSVRSANKILVLDGGTISESGTHEELMSADGLYASLFKLQASEYF